MLELFSYTLEDVSAGRLSGLSDKIAVEGENSVAQRCGVGVPTLRDIVAVLM